MGADFVPPAAALNASPLVMRPSRPEPATCPALILFSARIFAADGAAAAPVDLAAFTGAAAGAAAGADAAAAGTGEWRHARPATRLARPPSTPHR